MSRYPLHTDATELERLAFQHAVWKPHLDALLDRLEVPPDARALDLGAGPGFTTEELARRVPRGSVIALEASPRWAEELERRVAERRLANVTVLRGRVEEVDLEPESLDLVLARWVFSFLPEPAAVLARLARALRPGGRVAIQDYNHEGVSLFPESEGFRAAVRATRALYAQNGGDTWVAARLPRALREVGLVLERMEPHVICGGPGSDAFRWAGLFFPHYSASMVEAGLLTAAERERFLAEWAERERDPASVFFSPMVVDVVARRPAG